MAMGPASSEELKTYFARLKADADRCYQVARAARSKGFDPELEVEIPQTEDLASRVERLLTDYGVSGVAARMPEPSRADRPATGSIPPAQGVAQRPARSE